jgi:branched-subunit amino acid aminotransferase/4-amino-4-deoxychorismate lyase
MRERNLGARIRTFSVYDIDRGLMRQIETLILHALGGKHVLRWNKHMGRFFKTAKEVRSPKPNRSDAAKRAWKTRRKNSN